jgi:hypothetical protein
MTDLAIASEWTTACDRVSHVSRLSKGSKAAIHTELLALNHLSVAGILCAYAVMTSCLIQRMSLMHCIHLFIHLVTRMPPNQFHTYGRH